MSIWTFKDFIDGRGENPIRAWLEGLPEKVRVKFTLRLQYLSAEVVHPRPYVAALHDKKGEPCAGLSEIRLDCDGNAYRPLGYYGPGPGEFTLLVGAREKGGRLEPRGACTQATNRKALIEAEEGHIRDHEYV